MTTVVDVIGAVLGLAVVVLAVVALGWWLALQHLDGQRQWQRLERALLDAEWQTLERTRQLRTVFLEARRAMQQAAQASDRDSGRR